MFKFESSSKIQGSIAFAQVLDVRSKQITVQINQDIKQHEWHGPKWNLYVAGGGLKGGRGDWLVEKAVELGAWALIPVVTERSRVMGGKGGYQKGSKKSSVNQDEAVGRVARWRRLSISACKQCLRFHNMEIEDPVDLPTLIEQTQHMTYKMVADQGGKAVVSILQQMEFCRPPSDLQGERNMEVALVVGPEGGFSERELFQLQNASFQVVGLGSNRLRVETAALALLTACNLVYDEMCL